MSDQIYKDGQYLTEKDRKLVDEKTQDMKLQDLLDKLEFRQMQERKQLAERQRRELNSGPFTGAADVIRSQEQRREEQEKQFAKDRESYVADYHRANSMRDEQSRRESLERGLNPDKPKLTR